MKIVKWVVGKLNFFVQLLKTNKLTRLLIGFSLTIICMKLSETWSFFGYLAFVFLTLTFDFTMWSKSIRVMVVIVSVGISFLYDISQYKINK